MGVLTRENELVREHLETVTSWAGLEQLAFTTAAMTRVFLMQQTASKGRALYRYVPCWEVGNRLQPSGKGRMQT